MLFRNIQYVLRGHNYVVKDLLAIILCKRELLYFYFDPGKKMNVSDIWLHDIAEEGKEGKVFEWESSWP